MRLAVNFDSKRFSFAPYNLSRKRFFVYSDLLSTILIYDPTTYYNSGISYKFAKESLPITNPENNKFAMASKFQIGVLNYYCFLKPFIGFGDQQTVK